MKQYATLLPMLALGMSAFSPSAISGSIDETLYRLYEDTRDNCGNSNRPAVLCSGLLLRSMNYQEGKSLLHISDGEKQSEGISLSYLRRDVGFGTVFRNYKTGFILRPDFDIPATENRYDVYCSYPMIADSNNRSENGCGDNHTTAQIEKYCDELDAESLVGWLRNYTGTDKEQCAFDLRPGVKSNRAEAFMSSLNLRLTPALQNKFSTPNEIRINEWGREPETLPHIMSFYHIDESELDGLSDIRHFQSEWYTLTGKRVPIARLILPAAQGNRAKFDFSENDQLIFEAPAEKNCEHYVKKANWIKRDDPGAGKEIFSLSVTPTTCGRESDDSQTNHFFNELAQQYYFDTEWKDNEDNPHDSIRSMRRQLTCHFIIARNKAVWNLEPSRPYTSIGKSIESGCNNL